jgi:hypothetical protein
VKQKSKQDKNETSNQTINNEFDLTTTQSVLKRTSTMRKFGLGL